MHRHIRLVTVEEVVTKGLDCEKDLD